MTPQAFRLQSPRDGQDVNLRLGQTKKTTSEHVGISLTRTYSQPRNECVVLEKVGMAEGAVVGALDVELDAYAPVKVRITGCAGHTHLLEDRAAPA